MNFRFTRDFYISKDDTELKDDESGAVAYVSPERDNGKVTAKGFGGKRQKPDFHYIFKSTDDALTYIQGYFERQRDIVRDKRARRAERTSYTTSLKVGDILESSWGYEQTNVDFYQVVEVKPSGKTVVIREIASKMVENDEYVAPMAGHCLPIKDDFTGEPQLKRVGPGDSVSIASYTSAHPWNGKPAYCSWYY